MDSTLNTPQNQSYKGPFPPLDMYSSDSMNIKERERFLEWYNEQSASGCVFNFQNEIVRYCKQDVTILRLTCLAFRKTFTKFGVDPFVECTTIASTCMRLFRKNFLKKNQIGIVPPRGYRWCENQSQKAVHWICWMENCILRRFIGLTSVAKLCLNSLWGKFGQRENMTQTEVVTKPERLTELLTCPSGHLFLK